MRKRPVGLAVGMGNMFRERREALGLTQEEVADRALCSVEYYARLERGLSLPRMITFARLVGILALTSDDLQRHCPIPWPLGGTDHEPIERDRHEKDK